MEVFFLGCVEATGGAVQLTEEQMWNAYKTVYQMRKQMLEFIFAAKQRVSMSEMPVFRAQIARLSQKAEQCIQAIETLLATSDHTTQAAQEALMSLEEVGQEIRESRAYMNIPEMTGLTARLLHVINELKQSTLPVVVRDRMLSALGFADLTSQPLSPVIANSAVLQKRLHERDHEIESLRQEIQNISNLSRLELERNHEEIRKREEEIRRRDDELKRLTEELAAKLPAALDPDSFTPQKTKENLLGGGASGTVYRGTLQVAAKTLQLVQCGLLFDSGVCCSFRRSHAGLDNAHVPLRSSLVCSALALSRL